MNHDPFAGLFPGSRQRGPLVLVEPARGPASSTSLSTIEVVRFVRVMLPELAGDADRETRSNRSPDVLGGRPASWSLALLTLRAVTGERQPDTTHPEAVDSTLWTHVGLPRIPGRAEAQRYLQAARQSPMLKSRSARALWSVLPAVTRSGQLPGGYVDAAGTRRVLGVNAAPTRTHERRPR